MILLIDNYDSFTFNIEQYLGELKEKVRVVRNDMITLAAIRKMKPECIVISPGPGNPDEAGVTLDLIEEFAGEIPILGVCLGHQAIAQAFGGTVKKAPRMMHGKVSHIKHDGKGVYRGLAQGLQVTRYHSLHVPEESLPAALKVTSRSEDGLVMGIRHKKHLIEGVQFHPESFQTQSGHAMFENFLEAVRTRRRG